MLYFLAQFSDTFGALNVFRYLTFRTGGAVMTALLVAFVFGPAIIRWLRAARVRDSPFDRTGRNPIF